VQTPPGFAGRRTEASSPCGGSNNISIVDPNNITGPITTLVSGITFTFNAMVAVSNDSSKIATAFGSNVGVYDASDGSVIGTIGGLGG
jgi:hypothetical protein